MEFTELLAKRRSRRAFLSTPIPHKTIDELMYAAQRAPMSCNLQLTQFIVVDDKAVLERLAKEVSYKFGYAPCCIVTVQDTRMTVEHGSGTITTGMMVENMILRAEELGLGTCPMAGFSGDALIKKILNIPKELSVMLLISVGYPDTNVYQSPMTKISFDKMFAFNTYTNLTMMNPTARLDKISIEQIADYRNRIAPVYLDRWRLATLSPKLFDAVVKSIRKNLPKTGTLADLVSYDGEFLKRIHELEPNLRIVASDYLDVTLNFLQKELGCEIAKLTHKNTLPKLNQKPDLITCIFKLEHTPHYEQLISSATQELVSGGLFFIAVYHEIKYKTWLRKIKISINSWRSGRPYNIYEQNPFYKIGPYNAPSSKKIIADLLHAGCELLTLEQTTVDKRGGYIKCYLAKKLPISQQTPHI